MAEALSVALRNQRNETVGEAELPGSVFGGPVRPHLLHETVRMQLANRRAGTAATKTRAQVSGGGKKPWRQKGTGRARAGSNRSPIWVGGATVFGPQPRDYSYRMPREARRSALKTALALKAREQKLVVVDKIELESMKTKHVVQLMKDLDVRRALIVIAAADEVLQRSARNLEGVKVVRAEGANVYDILRYEHLVLTQEALAALVERVEH